MIKIIVLSIIILGVIILLRLKRKRYLMFIIDNDTIDRKYIKSLVEYLLGLCKENKRELILQNSRDYFGYMSKWDNYFDLTKFPKCYSNIKLEVDNNNKPITRMRTINYNINDPLLYSNLKRDRTDVFVIHSRGPLLDTINIFNNIVKEPYIIDYNLLVVTILANIRKVLGRYIILTVEDGYLILNHKYITNNLENRLEKMSIQTVVLLNDSDAFYYLRKKYNVINVDDIDILKNIKDPYLKYIVISLL